MCERVSVGECVSSSGPLVGVVVCILQHCIYSQKTRTHKHPRTHHTNTPHGTHTHTRTHFIHMWPTGMYSRSTGHYCMVVTHLLYLAHLSHDVTHLLCRASFSSSGEDLLLLCSGEFSLELSSSLSIVVTAALVTSIKPTPLGRWDKECERRIEGGGRGICNKEDREEHRRGREARGERREKRGRGEDRRGEEEERRGRKGINKYLINNKTLLCLSAA